MDSKVCILFLSISLLEFPISYPTLTDVVLKMPVVMTPGPLVFAGDLTMFGSE